MRDLELETGEREALGAALRAVLQAGSLRWVALYLPAAAGWEMLAGAGDLSLPAHVTDLEDLPGLTSASMHWLRDADASLGVLAFDQTPAARPVAVKEFIEVVRSQLAELLASWKRLREAIENAVRDEATGLYNRRFFAEALDRALAESARHQDPLSVLYADVDDFKAINDRHGHSVGDDVLLAVAQTLSGSVRASDVAARIGGEEFAVIMPRANSVEAVTVAERLRKAVHSDVHLPDRTVTLSIGVAVYPCDGEDAESLRRRADDALYWAKRTGKNVVALAQDVGAADAAERERVQSELIERILRGLLPPGRAIVEPDLSRALKTPQSALREALMRLQPEGLVRTTAAGTIEVVELSAAEVSDLYPIVGALEVHALESTVHTPEDLDELDRLNVAFGRPGNTPGTRIELDQRFHEALLAGCSNRSLLDLISMLKRRIRRYQYAFMGNMPTMQESVNQHLGIVEALRREDRSGAAVALEANWRIGVAPILALLQSQAAAA